jgi:hypothetical protein
MTLTFNNTANGVLERSDVQSCFIKYPQSSVDTVVLNDGITVIGGNAFAYRTNLRHIQVPTTLTSIANSPFYNTNIQEINLSLTTITNLGTESLVGMPALTQVILPDDLTHIGRNAFSYTPNLASIDFPTKFPITFDSQALENSGLTQLTIPDNAVVDVGFCNDCDKLETVTLGKNVNISVTVWTFKGCDQLNTVRFLGANASFHESAFENCPSLHLIEHPDGVDVPVVGHSSGALSIELWMQWYQTAYTLAKARSRGTTSNAIEEPPSQSVPCAQMNPTHMTIGNISRFKEEWKAAECCDKHGTQNCTVHNASLWLSPTPAAS